MTAKARQLCLFTALALALLAGAAPVADKAKITTTANKMFTGAMLADHYDKIEMEVEEAGAKKKMSWKISEVRSVQYVPPHMAYLSGMSFLKQRRYDKALEKIEEALGDKKAGQWVQRYGLFQKAEVLAKMAAADPKKLIEAVKAYEAVITKYPKFRYLPNVYVGMAAAYYSAEQYDKMGATLKKLDPKTFGEEWLVRRQLWEARLLEAKGSYDDAQKQFAVLAQEAGKRKDKELQSQALLRQGVCLLKCKKYDQGEAILFKLGKEAGDSQTRAEAYNALGDGLWARKEYNEAHFSYLRVAVLYLDTGEEHAKALYWAAKCFGKRGDKAGVKEMLAELKRLHKDSRWAKPNPEAKPKAAIKAQPKPKKK